ncbi:hypothetical protein SAMN05192561_1222 [Halopenitus malekzadehii]|uniref:Uncharacterized protein n=1 Tax=Halopenitus malekzadehii TaxID=1267564 RepID=A0A1H6JSD8_9EURY|nr:hypothetical protein [Halopenitus malekzadehii]SEH65473.1 hypothetical protein SAMN05192561_1222 [Halopenitus malekzadehii]
MAFLLIGLFFLLTALVIVDLADGEAGGLTAGVIETLRRTSRWPTERRVRRMVTDQGR